jgi:FAD/FMN-containing dehydrogenase
MELKTIKPAGSFYSDYLNWSKQVSGTHILTYSPKSVNELLNIVNWAWQNNFNVRVTGQQHNWSPLTIANGNNNSQVIFIDMSKYLTSVTINKTGESGTVTAQTGILMEDLFTALEKKKLGYYAHPAPGDLTLGGVLCINGHGTCVPAKNEKLTNKGTWGTMSNNIVSLSAIVWDAATRRYTTKTFHRNDPEIAPFLTCVGRTIIYEVTMQVPRNKRLRCQSFINVPASELFAANTAAGLRTFTHYLDQCGKVEAIWFPFTDKPWLKIWTETPQYPTVSKPVHGPYNYPFSDRIPIKLSDLIKLINNGCPEKTPDMGNLQMNLVKTGLGATIAGDLWGWSKDLLLYVKPDTLRVTANGYAIITRRDNIQSVLYDFVSKYEEMVDAYQKRNSWPMNGPIEVRVTGLDRPEESMVNGAIAPALSAARPVDEHPEWDVAIWLDILSMPDTPDANKFYNEMEQWIFSHYSGDYALTRVEWSKGWGYTDDATWENAQVINTIVPGTYKDWNNAIEILDKYDPHHVFTSPFMRKLLVKR